MKTTGIVVLLLLATIIHAQEHQPGIRQHFTVTAANGKTYPMTELISHPSSPRTKLTTLFEADGGQRYLFVYSEDVVQKKTTIEFRHLNSGRFLRGSFVLNYAGGTLPELRAARDRLKPEDYDVPYTIETNDFAGTQRIDVWRAAGGAPLRAELARRAQGELMSSLRASRLALAAGSPAAAMFCRMLETVVAPEQSCKRNREIAKTPVDDGCAFDAQFGYPCTN